MGVSRVIIPVIIGILIFGSLGFSQVFAGIGPALYSISVNSPNLYTINPNNANSFTNQTITLAGKTVTGANGLATHPFTGDLYAVIKIQGQEGRELVTINPDTAVATSIGTFSLFFSAITFNDAGVLFGITGWGDPLDNKALYTININNASATRICGIGTGNFGESLAFRSVDNLFYHGTGENNLYFDKFDSDLLNCDTTFINQDLTGLPQPYGEASALTWWPSQNAFLRAGGEPDLETFLGPYYLWKVPPDGSKPTLIGELDHKSKGLILKVDGETETLYSVDPFDTNLRTINTSTGVTIDDPVINLNSETITANGLAQDSSGTFYAIVKPLIGSQGDPRTLVTLTETSPGVLWTANSIAQVNQRFSGLAFDSNDNLFGISGEGSASDSLESIYQISKINGAETRKCGMSYGGYGEAIGFNPNDGLMYRESGTEVKSFEKFNATALDCSTITSINLSNTSIGEPRALAYWESEDAFIWAQRVSSGDVIYKVLPDGTVSLIGTLDHNTKGLAFEVLDTCVPPGSGDWNPFESCEMSVSATVDGNLILQNGKVLTIPNGVVLTVNGYVLVEVLSGIYIVNGGGINITS